MLCVKAGVINGAELFYCIFIWFSSSLCLILSSLLCCLLSLCPTYEPWVTVRDKAGACWGQRHRKRWRAMWCKWTAPRRLLYVQRNVLFKGTLQKRKVGLHGHLHMHGIDSMAISTISSLLICLHPLLHNVPCIKHRFGEPECEQLEV